MNSEGKVRTWVQSVAAGFLCVTAAVSFAVASGHPPPEHGRSSISTGWAPPGMHEAEAGADVGPGSDEALLVSSPWAD